MKTKTHIYSRMGSLLKAMKNEWKEIRSNVCSFSFHHRLIAVTPEQTAKFHEPVTLDFLDAELENDIKVEVRRKCDSSSLYQNQYWHDSVLIIPTNDFIYFWLSCQQIRKKMIDGLRGNYQIETLVKSQDEVILISEGRPLCFINMFTELF